MYSSKNLLNNSMETLLNVKKAIGNEEKVLTPIRTTIIGLYIGDSTECTKLFSTASPHANPPKKETQQTKTKTKLNDSTVILVEIDLVLVVDSEYR